MGTHRTAAPEDIIAMLARAIAMAHLPVPDLVLDTPELELTEDALVLEAAFGASSAAKSGDAPLPEYGTKPISIRVPRRVIRAFKLQAARTGANYQGLMNRVLNTAANGFA